MLTTYPNIFLSAYVNFNIVLVSFSHSAHSYILRDVRPHIPKGYIYTLHDIGLVINKLMGGAYR